MDESLLSGRNIGVLAMPDLHSWFLNGARERKCKTPWHAALEAGIHRTEAGRGQLSRLTAGKKRDTRHSGGDSAQEALHGGVGDFFVGVLVRTLQSGYDHIGLEDHALQQDTLGDELREECVLGPFGDFGTELHGVVAIHQHLRLDDGNDPGFLAKSCIESENECVGIDARIAWDSVADGYDCATRGAP